MEQFFEVTVRENNSGAVVYNTTTTTDLQLEKLDIKNLSAGMSYIATVSITYNQPKPSLKTPSFGSILVYLETTRQLKKYFF